ncbi:MAG: 23S rRNA (adenine(2030)-N(6))-methyltransferase RlmJ [Pseudomonadota bacterium]
MNYKHIYHAGNFADVLKHSVLILALQSLHESNRPFFVLDTHAGRGRYNLNAPEALKSKEAEQGVHRAQMLPEQSFVLKTYLDEILAFNPASDYINIYPGSPAIIQKFLRNNDKAAFCELNEKEFFKLHALFHDDKRIKTVRGDGYEALLSFIPPREKHGLVLVDPPFERKNEIMLLEDAILTAWKRWPNGTFILWYPVKDQAIFDAHYDRLNHAIQSDIACYSLRIPSHFLANMKALQETAIIVINPPHALQKHHHNIDHLADEMFFDVMHTKSYA